MLLHFGSGSMSAIGSRLRLGLVTRRSTSIGSWMRMNKARRPRWNLRALGYRCEITDRWITAFSIHCDCMSAELHNMRVASAPYVTWCHYSYRPA